MTVDPKTLEQAQRIHDAATELLLSVKQYATHCGIHEQTVYTAIRRGRLRFGRVVRVTDDVIRIAVPVRQRNNA